MVIAFKDIVMRYVGSRGNPNEIGCRTRTGIPSNDTKIGHRVYIGIYNGSDGISRNFKRATTILYIIQLLEN